MIEVLVMLARFVRYIVIETQSPLDLVGYGISSAGNALEKEALSRYFRLAVVSGSYIFGMTLALCVLVISSTAQIKHLRLQSGATAFFVNLRQTFRTTEIAIMNQLMPSYVKAQMSST